MNRPLILLGLAALAPAALPAAPLVSFGNGTDLFFNGQSSVQYLSNLYFVDGRVAPEESAWLYQFRPGLELRVGRPGSAARATLFLENTFNFYKSTDDLDNDNLSVRLAGSYAASRSKIETDLRWYETDQSTADIRNANGLVQRSVTDLSLRGEYTVSPKTRLGFGFRYDSIEYEAGPPYSDRDGVEIPVNVFYAYSPKLDLSVGYRFRDSGVDLGVDSQDHFLNVGVRGEILPKVTGRIQVGQQERDFDNGASEDMIATAVALDWSAGPKTVVSVAVDRDFGTSAGGGSIERSGGGIQVRQQFTPLLAASAFVDVLTVDYDSGRTDDNLQVGLGLSYSPNRFLRFGANYAFQDNDSNQLGASFDSHILNFSASLRY